jgi:hypothetical protein
MIANEYWILKPFIKSVSSAADEKLRIRIDEVLKKVAVTCEAILFALTGYQI